MALVAAPYDPQVGLGSLTTDHDVSVLDTFLHSPPCQPRPARPITLHDRPMKPDKLGEMEVAVAAPSRCYSGNGQPEFLGWSPKAIDLPKSGAPIPDSHHADLGFERPEFSSDDPKLI